MIELSTFSKRLIILKRKQLYIVFLSWLQLIVLIAAFTIKYTHHHADEQLQKNQTNKGITLSKTENPCPICQFEFVHFISKEIKHTCISQPVSNVINIELSNQIFKISFYSFSLRAPPAC